MREEELQFVAQPYLFKPQEASKLTILLHPTSYIASGVTHLAIRFFLKEINTFIHQGCIKLSNCDSKNIYNVTKDLFICCSFKL